MGRDRFQMVQKMRFWSGGYMMVEVVMVLRIFINVSIKCGSLRGTRVLLDKNVSLTLLSRLPLMVFNQEVVCGGMAAVWVRGTVGGRFWCTI